MPCQRRSISATVTTLTLSHERLGHFVPVKESGQEDMNTGSARIV